MLWVFGLFHTPSQEVLCATSVFEVLVACCSSVNDTEQSPSRNRTQQKWHTKQPNYLWEKFLKGLEHAVWDYKEHFQTSGVNFSTSTCVFSRVKNQLSCVPEISNWNPRGTRNKCFEIIFEFYVSQNPHVPTGVKIRERVPSGCTTNKRGDF